MTIENGIPIAGKQTHAASGYCTARNKVRLGLTLPFAVFDALKAEAIRQNTSIAHIIRTYAEIGLRQERGPLE